MSKQDIKVPILIDDCSTIRRLLELILSPDGSIYFVFPRKKGYKVDRYSEKKFYKGDYIVTKRNFIEMNKKYDNPKISFHPGKKVIHINSNKNVIKYDNNIHNFASSGYELYYLLQIVFPLDYSNFDEYNKTIDKPEILILNSNDELKPDDLSINNKNLSIELVIHTNDILPEPISNCKRKIIFSTTFSSPYNYSVTLFMSQLPSDVNEGISDTLLNINTQNKSIMYYIKPINNK